MSDMNEFLKDYIFSGIDDEGLTSNDEEIMRYVYGDDALETFANQTVKIPYTAVENAACSQREMHASWICDAEGNSKLKKLMFELFPGSRCHPRTGEEEAMIYLERNRDTIIRFADAFGIPATLFAAILYTEMTWSRIGHDNANALSYIKGRIDGSGGSLGPGQVQASHLSKWNNSLSNYQASDMLVKDKNLSLASSARVLSEKYIMVSQQNNNYEDEKEMWGDVAEKYNSRSGNFYYRAAFMYSLKVVSEVFPTKSE